MNSPNTPSRFHAWRTWWTHSLRTRLVTLSLAPLLLAFPLIMGVVIAIGGSSFDRSLALNALGKVEGVRTYLNQIKARSLDSIKQQVGSERLPRLLAHHLGSSPPNEDLGRALVALARENQFDFLVIADQEGRVIAASTPAETGSTIPETFVTR